MSISQRKDGRYLVKFKEQPSGKWRQKSFRTLEEAEAFETETAYDKEENYRITVAESIVAYLKAVPHCDLNVKLVERLISGPLAILATRFVDTLTRRDLEAARDAIRADAKGRISNYTVNRRVGFLIAAWRWCASEDLVQTVPWGHYRKLPEGRPGTNCGDKGDFMLTYSALPEMGRWAVRTLIALCCRPGKELRGITWENIDLNHAVARIWMPKVRAEKTIRIPAWWVEEARPRREKALPTHPVCPGLRADRPVDLHSMWHVARRRAGVSRCPLYTARHLAASMMMEAGADAAAVAAQLGHRNITTTGTFYIHASAKGQEAAAASLPDLVRVGAENCDNALE